MDKTNNRDEWKIINDYSESNPQDKIDELSKQIIRLEQKIDRLTQSQKSLLDYFSSTNKRDYRELNYNIRSYKANNRHPTSFVPSKTGSEL